MMADALDRNIIPLEMCRRNLNVRGDCLNDLHLLYLPVWYVFGVVVVSAVSVLLTSILRRHLHSRSWRPKISFTAT